MVVDIRMTFFLPSTKDRDILFWLLFISLFVCCLCLVIVIVLDDVVVVAIDLFLFTYINISPILVLRSGTFGRNALCMRNKLYDGLFLSK